MDVDFDRTVFGDPREAREPATGDRSADRPGATVRSSRATRRRRTRLEITLMCLLARAPRTGAGLVGILREFPLGGHGQSPGAVYPALERLERAEFVRGRFRQRQRDRRRGRRPAVPAHLEDPRKRRREYLLTRRGIAELRRWAREPVTRTDMLERPDYLLLRFAILPGLAGVSAPDRFVAQYEAIARGIAEDTRAYLECFEIDAVEVALDMSPWARRALELTIEVMEARWMWARRIRREGIAGGVSHRRRRRSRRRGYGRDRHGLSAKQEGNPPSG